MYVSTSGSTSRNDSGGEGVPPGSAHGSHSKAADATHVLSHSHQAPGAARRVAQGLMDQWKVAEPDADSVVLVVSELVANAVEHALPPLVLHLNRHLAEKQIWVGVSDSGTAPQEGPWTSSCTDDEHGRGLGIIEALAEAHGTHAYPDGTTMHWALISIP
jgi:anti-sigma regulatory factor (Ser/Thr protein kinase)